MADFEVYGDAILNEDQFQEQAEGLQYEMQGDAESIDTAQSQNEERNDQLGIISRGIMSIVRFFLQLAAIFSGIILILREIGNALDIDFSDLRSSIINVLQEIVAGIKDAIPGSREGAIDRATSALNPFELTTITGQSLGDTSGGRGISQALEELNLDISVLTSRNQMTGDSTQQDQQTDTNNDNEGSWGVPFF